MKIEAQPTPRRNGFEVLALAILISCIVLVGCTSQTQVANKTGNSTISKNNGDMGLTENKTGAQMTNETIASVLPDGTYSNNVTYAYHAGVNTVDITLTVQNDIVTNASVIGVNPDPISAHHIQAFNDALPTVVIGKRIDQLNLPHAVAGSSLTTAAFNNYVNSLIGHQ